MLTFELSSDELRVVRQTIANTLKAVDANGVKLRSSFNQRIYLDRFVRGTFPVNNTIFDRVRDGLTQIAHDLQSHGLEDLAEHVKGTTREWINVCEVGRERAEG